MEEITVGSVFPTTKAGDLIVLEYYSSTRVKVKFLETGTVKFCCTRDLSRGYVRDPNTSRFKLPEGTVLKSLRYGSFEILKDEGQDNVSIKFIDTGYRTKVSRTHIKYRHLRDPLRPVVYGVGYLGVGEYSSRKDGVRPPSYFKWKSMLDRCYGTGGGDRFVRYRDGRVTVCEDWHNYQNFAKWFEDNEVEGWELDKDLKGEGNLYSPDSCVFLPALINKALVRGREGRSIPSGVTRRRHKYVVSTGVGERAKCYIGIFHCPEIAFYEYKRAKEAYIKSLADQFKKDLAEDVHYLLHNFQVVDNSNYPWG